MTVTWLSEASTGAVALPPVWFPDTSPLAPDVALGASAADAVVAYAMPRTVNPPAMAVAHSARRTWVRMCCSLTESDGWPEQGHGFVRPSRTPTEGGTHSVRRGTGLVRRANGQPREAPRVVVSKDRGRHGVRRLRDADRR